MNNKYLQQSIDRLSISCKTIKNLKKHNIENMQQLCQNSKNTLQEIGVSLEELKVIDNEIGLLGLNLRN